MEDYSSLRITKEGKLINSLKEYRTIKRWERDELNYLEKLEPALSSEEDINKLRNILKNRYSNLSNPNQNKKGFS